MLSVRLGPRILRTETAPLAALAVAQALREIHATNPEALMFGTDLPSTRAERPYSDSDFGLVIEALGADAAREVFHGNAARFYRSGIGFTGQQQDRVGGD